MEGIPAFVADEHTINMDWMYSNAMGGVRLQVRQRDARRAVELLGEDRSHLLEDEMGKDDPHVCSFCGSQKMIAFTKGKRPAFIVFLLLGFPLFSYQHGLKCECCGEFKRKD